jgi:glutamine synthetase
VPAPRGNSTRVEIRSPDPTCNPYLTFAAILAAGLDGVKNRIIPPPSADRNIFKLNAEERKAAGIDTLPGSLFESNAALLEDELICNALGSHIIENLNTIAEMEWDAFRTMVHPWELEQYLSKY